MLLGLQTYAQEIEPENGVINSNETVAFTNARIVVSATETIERGTLVIKKWCNYKRWCCRNCTKKMR